MQNLRSLALISGLAAALAASGVAPLHAQALPEQALPEQAPPEQALPELTPPGDQPPALTPPVPPDGAPGAENGLPGVGDTPPAAEAVPLAPPSPPTAAAPERSLDDLYAALAAAKTEAEASRIATEIQGRHRRSGSATADLLLAQSERVTAAGDIGAALDILDALTRLYPEFAEGWNRRALAAYQSDDYAEALSDVRRALALEPRHLGAIAGLAAILAQLDREAQALVVYDQLLALNPRDESARKARDRLRDDNSREI